MDNEMLNEWWNTTDFNFMERVTRQKRENFSPDEGYQDFVDWCNEWWGKLSFEEKLQIKIETE